MHSLSDRDVPDGFIRLHGSAQVSDSKGKGWKIVGVDIRRESYIPDVHVRMQDDYLNERELYEDDTFLAGVMALLRAVGYEGEEFGRAELGMQCYRDVVLEPGKEFCAFAETKGWTYQGYREPELPEGAMGDAIQGGGMSLDAFVATTIEELRKFADQWRVGHAKNPENYPMAMGEGDWFEQFLTTQTTGG